MGGAPSDVPLSGGKNVTLSWSRHRQALALRGEPGSVVVDARCCACRAFFFAAVCLGGAWEEQPAAHGRAILSSADSRLVLALYSVLSGALSLDYFACPCLSTLKRVDGPGCGDIVYGSIEATNTE